MSYVDSVEPLTQDFSAQYGGSGSSGADQGGVFVEPQQGAFSWADPVFRAVWWYVLTGLWIAAGALVCSVLVTSWSRWRRDSLHISGGGAGAAVPADRRSLRKKLS